MAFHDGIKSAPIAYIGVVSVILTFVLVLLLQVLFLGQRDAMIRSDLSTQGRPAELADLTARQQTQLTRREMVDRERGIVTIGIKRAMELVATELAAGRLPADVMGPAPVAAGGSAPAAEAAGGPTDGGAPAAGDAAVEPTSSAPGDGSTSPPGAGEGK
jgi:hypothetical protein